MGLLDLVSDGSKDEAEFPCASQKIGLVFLGDPRF